MRSALSIASATISRSVWGVVALGGKASLEIEELSTASIDWVGLIWGTSTVGLEVGTGADLIEWVANVVEFLGVASWLRLEWSALAVDTSGLETTLKTCGTSLTSVTRLDTSSVVTESTEIST